MEKLSDIVGKYIYYKLDASLYQFDENLFRYWNTYYFSSLSDEERLEFLRKFVMLSDTNMKLLELLYNQYAADANNKKIIYSLIM